MPVSLREPGVEVCLSELRLGHRSSLRAGRPQLRVGCFVAQAKDEGEADITTFVFGFCFCHITQRRKNKPYLSIYIEYRSVSRVFRVEVQTVLDRVWLYLIRSTSYQYVFWLC